MRNALAALAMLATVVIAGCAIDPSGLGEDIELFEDATTTTDGVVSDVTVTDSGTSDASIDAIDTSAAESATTDGELAEAASDAAEVLLDVADTTVADTADTLAPDTADTSVADTRDAAVPCPESDGKTYLGHCYFPLLTARTQAEQAGQCQAAGAHLATVTTAGEQNIVGAVASGDRWIGLVKAAGTPTAKASFSWITGESSQLYDNWADGDPNGGHLCARMQGGGVWGDSACTNAYLAVCERE